MSSISSGNSQRVAIRKALGTTGSIKTKDAKRIEQAIYTMCRILSDDYEDGIDDIYRKYAFEKAGQIIQFPDKKDEILQDVDGVVLDWDSVVYSDLRAKENRDTAEHAAGMKVTKGEFKCRNSRCRSDECYYYQDQTRSADEGATTYVVCSKCGHRYAFN